MSRTRFVWTAVALVCVMGAAFAGTVIAFPFGSPIGEAAAHAQEAVDGNSPGVTLPKVISEVKAQYTPEAMRAKIQGTLMMTAVVRTDGTPAEIQITKSLDKKYGLDDAAVAALRQWRFKPGRKDGKAVPVRVTIEMEFWLKE